MHSVGSEFIFSYSFWIYWKMRFAFFIYSFFILKHSLQIELSKTWPKPLTSFCHMSSVAG